MKKGFLSPIIVIVVGVFVIATIGLGAFYIGKKSSSPTTTNSVVQASPSPTDETVYTDEGSANWKTYTNTKYGYSIKYPTDKFTNCSGDRGFYLFEGKEGSRGCALGEETPELLIINSLEGTGNFKTSDYPNCYSVQTQSIQVDNLSAIKYSNTIFNDKGSCNNFIVGGAKNEVHIVLYKNNVPYNIVFYNDKNKDLKTQILSTFKFTQ